MPIGKFCEEKLLGHISTYFFGTLKPNSQETAENFEKPVLKVSQNYFLHLRYIPVNPY
jgi:hypothetical protein